MSRTDNRARLVQCLQRRFTLAPLMVQGTGVFLSTVLAISICSNSSFADGQSVANSASVNLSDVENAAGLERETPHSESENTEIRISNPLQAQSEFAKTYPSDAPYALVAIRFPAQCSPNFVRNLNRLKMFRRDTLATLRNYVDEQVLKSAYYATEFYSYLSARLPEDSVIMEPMKIGFSAEGKVVCSPICKTVPAIVTVDLFSSINPERVRATNSGCKQKDTFAEYVNIVANFTKSTKYGQTAIAGLPVIASDKKQYGLRVDEFYNTIGNGSEPRYVDRVGELPVSNALSDNAEKFLELKTTYKCSLKSIEEPERLIDGDGDVPCVHIWSLFNEIIANALRSENFEELKPYLMASFVEEIDPEMAELLARGVKIEHTAGLTRRRLDLLSRYMENERREIFCLEAQHTEESLYSGELGDSMRSIAKSELEYLRHRSASKRRQYAVGLLGLAVGAGSLAASASMQTPAFSNLLTTVSFASVGMMLNETRLQQKLKDTFQQFERQSTDTQTTFMLKFGSDALEVSGNNISDLRARFKAKYQEQFEAYAPKGADL